jgi:hypothetical protein
VKPVISVLLPTIRPEKIEARLAELQDGDVGVPVEIVVVADFASPTNHSPWYVRKRGGVIDAIDFAYRVSRGDYVFVTNDETTVRSETLRVLYAAAQTRPGYILSPRHWPPYNFVYYGKKFLPYPFVHRSVVEQLGSLFDPAYKGFYADPDFCLRAHAAGVPMEEIDTEIRHYNDIRRQDHVEAVSTYLEKDRALFRSRWDHLGQFRDP